MTESNEQLLTVSPATRACAEAGHPISEAGFKQAADRGEIPYVRTAGRGIRLFRLKDIRAFAKARQG